MKLDAKPIKEYSTEVIKNFYSKGEIYKDYTNKHSFRSGEQFVYNNFFIKKGSLLDVGCGGGRTTFLIHQNFNKIIGIDINETLIKSAYETKQNEKIPIDFFVGDAVNLSFCNNCFDNVLFSYNGIEGILFESDRFKCLNEIYRVLKKNGFFIFSTHSLFSWPYVGFHIKKLINLFTKMIPLTPNLFKEFDHLKLGDIFVKNAGFKMAWHITNPIMMIIYLKKAGFKLIYINNCERISRGLIKSSCFSIFGTQSVFYVTQKTDK